VLPELENAYSVRVFAKRMEKQEPQNNVINVKAVR
jgi:hypothetical protein